MRSLVSSPPIVATAPVEYSERLTKNDILYVRGEVVREVSFKVYDRWGEKVFETSDLTKGWDGTFRGQPCEPGVYDYHLQVTCLGMKRYFKKGNVTLLR